MSTPWRPNVGLITNGEPVEAGIANRPSVDLKQRTDNLKEVLDGIVAGKALVLRDVALDPATLTGSPVYLNDTTNIWTSAKADMEYNDDGVPIGLAKQGYVLGIVAYKSTATMGGVAVNGEITFGAEILDVLDAGQTYAPGEWFLSPATAGRIVASKPAVGIRVGVIKGPDVSGMYHFFVTPNPHNILEDHIHYKVQLVAEPAGIPNCAPDSVGNIFDAVSDTLVPAAADQSFTHTVDTPDSGLPGWLPANSTYFPGKVIPEGAVFGYNITADANLAALWPPTPAASAYVELNGRGLPASTVTVNEHGIWWMTNCFGTAPWPYNILLCNSSSSSSSSSSGDPDCIYEETKIINLWFTKMIFKTGNSLVTSLEALDASVNIVCATDHTKVTNVGALAIGVNFNFGTSENNTGSVVIKDFDPATYTFKKGPVIEKIRSATPLITVSNESTLGDVNEYLQGSITLGFNDPNAEREGTVQLIALDNVTEENINDISYLSFPKAKVSRIRGKISVGFNTISETSNMQIYFWLMGRTAHVMAPMWFSYNVLSRPDPAACENSSIVYPSLDDSPGESTLTEIPGCTQALTVPKQYVEVATDPFAVTPGSLVYFTLQRKADDIFDSEVGLLQVRYVISPIPV